MQKARFYFTYLGGYILIEQRMNEKLPAKPNADDLVNEKIRFNEVLLIDENGEQLGVKSRVEAMNIAQSKDLDLFCVAPNGKPPVCKILNYGKYRFEQQKKAKEMRKNKKVIDVKEIQLSCNIGEHDFNTKLKAARKFLTGGDKVKISIRFKGRQLAFADQGVEMVNKFVGMCSDIAVVEKEPLLEGKLLMGVIAPKSQKN